MQEGVGKVVSYLFESRFVVVVFAKDDRVQWCEGGEGEGEGGTVTKGVGVGYCGVAVQQRGVCMRGGCGAGLREGGREGSSFAFVSFSLFCFCFCFFFRIAVRFDGSVCQKRADASSPLTHSNVEPCMVLSCFGFLFFLRGREREREARGKGEGGGIYLSLLIHFLSFCLFAFFFFFL